MSKQKKRRPTTRELDKIMKRNFGTIARELYELQNYVKDVITPICHSNINLLEAYIEFDGKLENFLKYMEEVDNNAKEAINKSPKKGKEKQTKGSGTSKTVSKNVKRIRPGVLQQGQRRSST